MTWLRDRTQDGDVVRAETEIHLLPVPPREDVKVNLNHFT